MQEVTTKLVFDRERNKIFFEVTNYYEKILVEKKYKEGDLLKNRISKPRNIRSNGKYRLLMRALGYFKNVSDEYYHNLFKKMFFGIKEIINPFTGEKEDALRSVSFDKMGELEFREYLTFVCDKLLKIDIDADELISEYKNEI